MKQLSLIKDKIDGSPFAVLLINKNSVTAYGAPGQGDAWAQWINTQNTAVADIDELLDVRLVAQKPVPVSSVNESYVSTFLDQETTDLLMSEINKKALLQIVETKSEPEPEFIDNEEIDLPDFTPIMDWPLSDVSLSAIDVAYKSHLTAYKAKAFHVDRQRRALELEVKWARAIWDNDRQGWRCPPNTVNGGQFTNRMGLGCSTGMIRRLGQTLMSIEDRNKLQMSLPGLEDPRGFLYRAGELIDQRAETRIRNFADRKERRAARRVRSMIAKQGKEAQDEAEKAQRKLAKEGRRFAKRGDKFREIYAAYTPDASVASRLRAATAISIRARAQTAEQRALMALNRSERRRYRAMRDVTESKLSPQKIKQLRDFGGKIPGSKLGGYVIADPARDGEADVFDHDGKPHVWRAFSNLDEMHANPWFGKDTLTDDAGKEINNPHKDHKWVTTEEVLAMASLNRATKPAHDWIEMRRGRGFRDFNGQNGAPLIRFADADEFKKIEKKNGHHGVRTKLKDNGKGIEYTAGKGRGKTKPAQGGPIGDSDFTPDELPPTVRKRVAAAWTRSRQNLGEWIRGLDPLLEDDGKSRRQKRRDQRSKNKITSAARATNALTEMLGAKADVDGINKFLRNHMGAGSPYTWNGFDLGFLNQVFTKDPLAPPRRYGWNDIVGTPTPEFEYLKGMLDRIISEHGAEVMTQSLDSYNDLSTLVQVLRPNRNDDETTHILATMSYHNARVVELFDGEESRKVIMLDSITIAPWYGKTVSPEDGVAKIDGTSGIVGLTSQSVEINAPQDVIELAEAGKLSIRELVKRAKEADTTNQGSYLANGAALGYSIPERTGAILSHNSTREIEFNRAGAPLLIAAESYYGGYSRSEGDVSTHIPGSRFSKVDTRNGGLISGAMRKETILTPEGEEAWENSSIDPWTGLPLDPDMQSMFSRGPRYEGGGRKRGRRTRTGAAPQKNSIIQRFFTGEGRQLARDRREAKRVIKGKLPRDTRPIRQRIQAAALERGRRVTGQARPEWLQAPDIDRAVLERESLIATGELPKAPADANRVKLPFIYDFPTPKEFPQGADWINSGDNRERIDDLNDSLYELGQSFYPPVKQEDIDKAPELAEIVDQWQKDLNDPSQQSIPGESSNWGHAAWVPGESVTYVFDTQDETMPPIAVVHNDTGTTHLIGKDGRHLVSLVSRTASNGDDVWVPVGSRATHARLNRDDSQQTGFIQTLLGKFRRRNERQKEQTKPGIAGLRQRRRALTLREQPDGTEWGVQQFKDHAEAFNIGNANIIGPYSFPTQQRVGALLDEQGPYNSQQILDSVEKIANRLTAQLRRQLNLSPSEELTTAAVRDKIDDLNAAGKKREAGIMTNDLHDLAVLDDILQSGDTSLVDNLKPGRRHQIIEEYPTFTLTDKEKRQRRAFSAADIVTPADVSLSQAGRQRSRVRTFASGTPLLDEASPNASSPVPPRIPTGPALIPGVGDVTGTIVFQNGKYFDTTTGKYLEDLSGLDTASPDILFIPRTMDDAQDNGLDFVGSNWPVIRTDTGPGMPTRNGVLIAPGQSNPEMPKSGTRRNAVNRVTSVAGTFTEAFYMLRNRWRVLASGDSSQTGQRWGRSVHNTSEMLDMTGNPMLSVADGLESEAGLSTIFAPVNNPRSAGSGASIAVLISALRGQSRKSSNPLFAEFLDESVLSEDELRAFPTATDRSGFAGGTRSVFAVLDALGIRTDLPFETIYTPSGGTLDSGPFHLPGAWDMFDDDDVRTLAIRHLNEALQLDYVAERMKQTLANGLQANWDRMYGTQAGGAYNLTPSVLADIERQRDLAWERASRSLVSAIKEAEEARNSALRMWRDAHGGLSKFDMDSDELYEVTGFVGHGVNAEQLQALLTKHVLTNPAVMDALTYSAIRRMEADAKATNIRMERLALLKSQAAAIGLRNKATYTPDDIDPITLTPILDPHGDGAVQASVDRTVPEVLQIIDEHAAIGFSAPPSIDPATGTSVADPILDEQIEALALADFAYQKSLTIPSRHAQLAEEYGYTGMPEANSTRGHLELDGLPSDAQAASGRNPDFWPLISASGYSGHPVLLSAKEFSDLATIEDGNGTRQALPIGRGMRSPRRRGHYSNILLRLKRAIVGVGGEQHGPGEYWTGRPAAWDRFGSEGVIGLLLRGRHRVGSVEILITDKGATHGNNDNGILAAHAYNSLWAVANALGARGFRGGVNWSHGRDYQSDLPTVRFDPGTGLFDAADLDALQRAVDELMRPGDASLGMQGARDAGKMTVEHYSSRWSWFVDSILPDFQGRNEPRVQAAIDERQRLNAFLAQNLSWMIQLAQLRRDESDPVNGKANKQWNRRLEAAQHELVMMHPNSRAALAGYDVLVRSEQNVVDSSEPDGIPGTRFGEYDMWEGQASMIEQRPNIIMLLNRSKTPMMRLPTISTGFSQYSAVQPSDPSWWLKQLYLEPSDFVNFANRPGPNATQLELDRWDRVVQQARAWGIDLI